LQLDLTRTDGRPHFTPLPDNLDAQKVYRAGVSGVGLPICFRMPNPLITQDAKSFKFVGSLAVETIVDTNSKIRLSQVVAGAPSSKLRSKERSLE